MTRPSPAARREAPAADGTVPDHLLRVGDLAPGVLRTLLDRAEEMKREPLGWADSLRGGAVGCVFEKPSTRTRVSLAAAAQRLGMAAVVLNRDELQLGHGETVADTARVLSSYLDAVAVRTFEHRVVERMAEVSAVPVVNALSNSHHPCQSLADLLALREHFGTLKGLRAAFVGDGGSNTCNSFLSACATTGMHLTIARPAAYGTDPGLLDEARDTMRRTGGSVSVTEDPEDAVRGAHAVYAEVWVPMDRRDEADERRRRLARYRVDDRLLAHAPGDAVVLHCLPAVRGEEITSEVLDGPRCLAWQQAANRLPTAQAVLHTLITAARLRPA
ncbi:MULTISPECIES: ornithine carbamoyltransferase [Streptomyces]|uniref:ornithine carbamoyltransferase n=1 Tax=Streptomyces TaxID=1883 RepID=UPI00163B71C7|nr:MULTISPECIES: ornithine carbamoyltransferase [Streptomyces]MBC2878680.1 ornithine carbamoyltransferase [Streptomyces sp. TYQ1024]UBI35124.1 ornithine carbamoyltransferase [Streptomyces mobaraensis]UKW27718.1 ornithine carbamoyltransferase [Streptomyces sp. TYQ1024]